ncbi:oxidoreductase [Actinomycetospora sp. NBRC 106375]|uniref:SDR family oxidoreductase n=1 Tax=Actinomycetospora sp. NBRC 106375 TaxID=3032207 RepID=UPI0024A09191|nr:SDR family oxidoreductase [Actinomycetospora sp. NBRC 106375]GLZ47519.1 oxidoreductase [Actinomycetospora sp. NBRC 106375]
MTSEQPPPQEQTYPGSTGAMDPEPNDEMTGYVGRDLLAGRRALITGGDSGIGRAVAVAFAEEGADVAISYLSEGDDAKHTQSLVEARGRRCVRLPGDIADRDHCARMVGRAVDELGGLDLLVNNAATQTPVSGPEELSDEQWDRTFATNVSSFFWITKDALPHLGEGSAIINTGSVNGLRGNKALLDYSAAKGAVHALTMSLSQQLLPRGIRVNCVAPGPVWTPLIPATMPEEKVDSFGAQAPIGRPATPDEIAPSYVFFAADRLSSYYSGEVLAPTGGETHPG